MSAAIPRGYVFVARRILSSTLWQMRPETRIVALTSIVIANHRPGKWCPDRVNVIPINRGEFVRSWRTLASECSLSVWETRTASSHLEKADFLVRKQHHRWSRFSIPKYNEYQNRDTYGKERPIPEGAVLIARKILRSPLWKLPAQDRVVAITCLLVAKYMPGTWTDGAHEIELSRGQFSATTEELAQWCHLPVDKVLESMAKLKDIEFVVETPREGCKVFVIPNYEYYQDPSNYGDSFQEADLEASEREVPPSRPPGTPQEPHKEVTRSPQGGHKEATGCPQDAHREATTNKKDNKDKKEEEGEEGGKGGVPPDSPYLFDMSSCGGTEPPLPPEERIVQAYHGRFPEVMGREKVRNHVLKFLRRGGNWEKGLDAVRAQEAEVPIWVILDPLLRKTGHGDFERAMEEIRKGDDHAGR